MLFNKTKQIRVTELFDDAVEYVTNRLNELDDCNELDEGDIENNYFQTIVLFYVITDLAIVNSKKDRQISQALFPYIDDTYFKEMDTSMSVLNNRFNQTGELYGQIIRGKRARGLWWPDEKGDMKRTGLSGCMFAFGDLYLGYNAKDYFNEPLKLIDPLFMMDMISIMASKVFPYINYYFEKIYSI